MTTIKNICTTYFETRQYGASVQNVQIQLKTMNALNRTILEIIDDVKIDNDKSPHFSNDFNDFYNKFTKFSILISESEISLNNYKELNLADQQIEIHSKNINIFNKRITDNKNNIEFIYKRLTDNKCCPICYEIFQEIKCDKIYITENCCNNKICGNCIEKWYANEKTHCIFAIAMELIKIIYFFIM